tara:strand:+ start:2536 stop:3693 length:1158 start_codon:yes stop_codon:yes gene_type:complete
MSEITSQYSQHRYEGQEALDLMAAPSLENDILHWNRLIDNVLTIHGSQLPDGSIPVFYTTVDAANSSKRISNTNSTLTTLEPGESYYFVMRSQSVLPITLPDIGGQIVGCDLKSCSTVSIEPLNDVNLVGKSNNKQFMLVCASGLTCGETYQFDFSSSLSNWPTYASPISGEFVAAKEKVEIPVEISFSKETGNLSQENLLNYKIYEDMNYHPCHTDDFNVYTIVKAKISPKSYIGLHDEDIFKIHCIDCLPECDPYATVRFVDSPLLALTEECCQENHNIVVDVKDARLGDKYDYRFISDSLKPLHITPPSGTVGFGKYYSTPMIRSADGEIVNNPNIAGGQINALFNLMQNTDTVLKIELTHRQTQAVSTDYLTVVCSGCGSA